MTSFFLALEVALCIGFGMGAHYALWHNRDEAFLGALFMLALCLWGIINTTEQYLKERHAND